MKKMELSNTIKRRIFGGVVAGMIMMNVGVCYAAYKTDTVNSEHYKYSIDLGLEYYEMPGKDHVIYGVSIRGEDVRNGSASVPYNVYVRNPKATGSKKYKSINSGVLSNLTRVAISGREVKLDNKTYDRATISYTLNGEKEQYFSEYNSEYK